MKTRATVTLKAEKALEMIVVTYQIPKQLKFHTDTLTLYGDDPVCETSLCKLLVI